MKSKLSLKILIALLAIGVTFASIAYFKITRLCSNNTADQSTLVQDAKLRKVFSYLRNANPSLEEFLLRSGISSIEELNQAYHKAAELHQYDLAIKLYKLGATDCYQEEHDILLIALHSGQFDLAKELAKPNYPISTAHIHAAKSLVKVDQPNWAFIYQKEDEDALGYSEYQTESKELVETLISLYKIAYPVPTVGFQKKSDHFNVYSDLFGKDSQQEFKKQLEQVLEGKYSFDTAQHGTQKRSILVDEQNTKVGIIKSKNELLAYALDYDHFAKVPPVVEIYIPECGQVVVQKWVADSKMIRNHQFDSEDSSKQANFIEQLHHVRLLDIRLGNSDRNKGNLLVLKHQDQEQLIPIDHDLIMFYIPNDLNWESVYLNLPFSAVTQAYINNIDLEKDALIMKDLGYSKDDIKAMKLRTTLLKMSVEKNLQLKQVDILFRYYYYDFLEKASALSMHSTQEQFQDCLSPHFQQTIAVIEQPIEVWKLLGNNFEFYL